MSCCYIANVFLIYNFCLLDFKITNNVDVDVVTKIDEDISNETPDIVDINNINENLQQHQNNINNDDDNNKTNNLVSTNNESEKMNVIEDNPSPNSLTEPMECGGNSIVSLNSPKNLGKILSDDVNMSENNSVIFIYLLFF